MPHSAIPDRQQHVRPRAAHAGRRRSRILLIGELRRLLAIALPIIVSQLGQVGMSTADTIMVGPLGPTSLAAIGVGSAIHFTAAMLCIGIVMGMGPLVSQAFGAGERDQCARVFMQGLWVALLVSVPFIVYSLLGGPIARALGQAPDVAELAGAYNRALAWGIFPFIAFVAFRQYLEGMGRSKPPMVITFVALFVNILGNWMFIYGVGDVIPAMGAVGTGHATSLTRWVMLLGILFYVVQHRELNPFLYARLNVVPRLLRRIIAIGTPIGTQMGLEVSLFAFAAVMMGWFGAIELASHQVTINIASTTFMVALGASMAGSVRVGRHIGARRPRMARRAALCTYMLSVGFMGCCALVFVTAPHALIGLYTEDVNIIRLGSMLLLVAAAFQLFDGAQVAGMAILRGAADTQAPMIIAALGYWVIGMPVAYYLGFHTRFGAAGVWAGLSLALGVVAVLLVIRVRRVVWKGALVRA